MIVTRTWRRVLAVAGGLAVIAVQLAALWLDVIVAVLTNPLTDAPRLPGDAVFGFHPLIVIANWFVLAIGWRQRWVWLLALGIGLITPVLALVLLGRP